MADYYTYKGDLRGFGGGTPVAYKYDPTLAGVLEAGEMVAWDADDNFLKRWVRTGTGNLKFIGISRDSLKGVRKLGNQPPLDPDRVSVFTTGIHELIGTTAETYTHGTVVYMGGTDTTKITSVIGSPAGVAVGVVWLPDGSSKSGVVRVPVLIDEHTKTQE